MPESPQIGTARSQLERLASLTDVVYAVALVLIAFAVAPAFWVISTSFNPAKSLGSGSLWPNDPGLVNYEELFNNDFFPYTTWLTNSL